MLTLEAILAELIKINTVNPPGNETAAALYLKEIFDAAGIPSEIIEAEKGRGNFIARFGSGERRLLFLSHTDVVPAGDDWECDPFSGKIENGLIWGRGALDCKGLVAAEAYAMLQLAKEGTPLNGTLIFAATADEERGGTLGVKYLLTHCPEKLRADFAVNEGAEEPLYLNGRMINFIQIGEKGTAWSRLEAKGRACHGSIPGLGENAVLKMVRALNALAQYKPPVVLIPEVKSLLAGIAKILNLDLEVTEENVDLLLGSLADKTFAETLRAVTRMTISPNVIQGGTKTNIVPDSCEAKLDIRILPGQDLEYVLEELRRHIGEDITIDIPNYHPPSFSPTQVAYYRVIEETAKEVMGQTVVCLPYISPGATDSRFLRAAGIPAYGINLMAEGYDPEIKITVHGKNERIDIKSLYKKAEFLVALAKKYLG